MSSVDDNIQKLKHGTYVFFLRFAPRDFPEVAQETLKWNSGAGVSSKNHVLAFQSTRDELQQKLNGGHFPRATEVVAINASERMRFMDLSQKHRMGSGP